MISGRLLWDDGIVADMAVVKHRAGYHLTYADLPANMYDVLMETAGKHPDSAALVGEDGRATAYSRLLGLVDAFAAHLHGSCAVKKGVQVGLLLPNGLEFAVAFLTLCKLGAVAVPLDPCYPARELEVMVGMANLKLLLAEAEGEFTALIRQRGIAVLAGGGGGEFAFPLARQDEQAKASVSGRSAVSRRPGLEDNVLLMFTSGTTETFKGALSSNLNLMHAVVTYERILGLGSGDKTVAYQPVCHVTGLVAILCLFIRVGGTIYCMKKKDPRRLLELVGENNVTFLHTVPSTITALLDRKDDFPSLPSLRQFAFGGSNLAAKFLRELKAWLPGVTIRSAYGLTETTSPAAIFPTDAAASFRIGSSGLPIPGVMMKVVDETGRELPNGMIGELCVRGTVVIDGYYQSDRGFDEEGWFKTGDMARLTDEGHVFIMDRKADVITRDGEKIWSYEIENLLHECPGVREAAVVGVADGGRGDAVAVAVTAEPGAAPDFHSVAAFLDGKLPRNKVPTLFTVVDRMPITSAGKIDKTSVASLFR